MSILGSEAARHRASLSGGGILATGSPDRAGRVTMAGAQRKTSALPKAVAGQGARTSKGFAMSLPHDGAGFKVRAATGRAYLPAAILGSGRGVARLPWSRVARRVA
jgi:hypothetical protein